MNINSLVSSLQTMPNSASVTTINDCVLQQDKHLITRVPDRYTQAEELIKLVNIDIDELQPLDGNSDDGSLLKAYKTRSELYGHPVDLVLVCKQKLSSSEKETITEEQRKRKLKLKSSLKLSLSAESMLLRI